MNKRTIGLALLACGLALATGPTPGLAQFSLEDLAIRAFDITVELTPVALKYEYTGGDIEFTSHGVLRGTTVAQLEVTATSPVTTARFDFDSDVNLTSVATPGYQVASKRLRDTLTLTFTPALPPGGKVPLTFAYEGGPDYIYNEFVKVGPGSLYPLLISPFGDLSANLGRVVLKITNPGGYNIAGTGKLISRDGNTSTWDSEVPVPWVALAGGQKHTVRDRTVAGVQMEFYVPPGEDRNLDKLADFAGRSVDYYSKLLYPFPYSQLRTVSLLIVGGGIGYPAFLLIDHRAFRNTYSGDLNRDSHLFQLMAHEILHSYVPSQTVPKGNGFIWLSEGFAEYLSLMAVQAVMGPEAFKRELQEERNLYASVVATTTEPALGAITFTNYHGAARRSIYAKGSLVLHMLRGVLGDEVFRKGLAAYFTAYRGKAARVSDFQEVMEQASGQTLDWFFSEWILERVLPDYTIANTTSSPNADGTFRTTVTVRNRGTGSMPVEIGFRTDDGVQIEKVVIASRGEGTVTATTPKAVTHVEIDPHKWLIKKDDKNDVVPVK
ncbi:MAG TPA: M1 family aminopeptidase [bacterium]